MQIENIRALGKKVAAVGTGGLLLSGLAVGVGDLDEDICSPDEGFQLADHVGELSADIIEQAQVVVEDDGDHDIADALDRMAEDVSDKPQHAEFAGC